MEAGPTTAAGMGEVPLTWADLMAYQSGAGRDFQPWELRLIRRLSGEYLSESMRVIARQDIDEGYARHAAGEHKSKPKGKSSS